MSEHIPSNTCYEGRGGASGRHCNFYPNCVCGDRDALGKAPATDVAALFAVQQENKRLRAALAAISCGTPDLMPPYRAMGAQQLREIASKALGNRPPENETNPRHTLDCDMVKHPNCTRCNCGSSIDPHYLEHVRQSPQGSVPTIGAPTALAAPGERLSSGDAIACISMALQNPPDTQEWSRLLSDCRHVIERLEDELVAAKSSRNDEQRLRRAAEKASEQLCNCGEFCAVGLYGNPGNGGRCRRDVAGLPTRAAENGNPHA